MNASSPPIEATVRDRIGTIVVGDPAERNALGIEVQAGLVGALQEFEGDDRVRAIVITGAGDGLFTSGANLRQLREYSALDGLSAPLQRTLDRVEACTKPTIAAVGGIAMGGGCELALACDIRVAANSARFALPETGLGILPGAGGTQRLSRLIGVGRALDMILTGRIIDADEAFAIGLVTRLATPGQPVVDAARGVAMKIAGRAPLAVALARVSVRASSDTDMRTGLALERIAQSVLHTTDDKQAGIEAFFEKRPPVFEGR